MPLVRMLKKVRAPLGFLGMIAIIVGTESLVATHPITFMDHNALSWSYANAQTKTSVVSAEVLCLGDSRVKFGLVPRVFEAATGMSTFNLAVTGGPAPSSYYLLRRALDSGAKPTAVIVDFDDKLLEEEPIGHKALAPWAELLTAREAWDLGSRLNEPEFAPGILVRQLLPTLRNRFELRNIVVKALRGRGPGTKEASRAALRNWMVNQGAQVSMKRTFKVPPEPPPPPHFVEGTWSANPQNVLFVERFLTLAEQRGIPVYWLLTPRCPGVQTWRDWYGGEGRFARFAASFLVRFPHVTILDARHSGYGDDVFIDTVHLDRDGALPLSAAVAAAMQPKAGLGAQSRWITLPQFQPDRGRVTVEDFEESRLALREEATSRRDIPAVQTTAKEVPDSSKARR